MTIKFKITPNMYKSRTLSQRHKRYDEYDEGGFDDLHDNYPKCEHCGAFITENIKEHICVKTGKVTLYCQRCHDTLLPKEYY